MRISAREIEQQFKSQQVITRLVVVKNANELKVERIIGGKRQSNIVLHYSCSILQSKDGLFQKRICALTRGKCLKLKLSYNLFSDLKNRIAITATYLCAKCKNYLIWASFLPGLAWLCSHQSFFWQHIAFSLSSSHFLNQDCGKHNNRTHNYLTLTQRPQVTHKYTGNHQLKLQQK